MPDDYLNDKFARDEDGMLLDCSHLKGWKKNPYAKNVHRERVLIIDEEIIKKFQFLAQEKGVDHRELMENAFNEYLSNNRPNLN